jgi:hypothetical protein
MMRKVSLGLVVLASAAVLARPAAAQGYGAGYMDIGPVIGFGGMGSGASVDIGARFEKGLKPMPSLGGGMLGIQIGGDYYSYGPSGYSFKVIFVHGTVNYHFKLADTKLDPFVGLGLGYSHVSCPDVLGIYSCSASAVDFVGKAGVRYFFSPKMAVYGDVGSSGAATINLGIMFKMK